MATEPEGSEDLSETPNSGIDPKDPKNIKDPKTDSKTEKETPENDAANPIASASDAKNTSKATSASWGEYYSPQQNRYNPAGSPMEITQCTPNNINGRPVTQNEIKPFSELVGNIVQAQKTVNEANRDMLSYVEYGPPVELGLTLVKIVGKFTKVTAIAKYAVTEVEKKIGFKLGFTETKARFDEAAARIVKAEIELARLQGEYQLQKDSASPEASVREFGMRGYNEFARDFDFRRSQRPPK